MVLGALVAELDRLSMVKSRRKLKRNGVGRQAPDGCTGVRHVRADAQGSTQVTDYTFHHRLHDGVVVLVSRFGTQLFTCRRLRKPCACAVCTRRLVVGDQAFGQLGNGMNRAERVCVQCVADAEFEKAR